MPSDTCGQDTANSPTAVTRWIFAGHAAALEKGMPTCGEHCFRQSQGGPAQAASGFSWVLPFPLLPLYWFLSVQRKSKPCYPTDKMTSAKLVPVQMTWEDCCSSKSHAGVPLQGESRRSDPKKWKAQLCFQLEQQLALLPYFLALDQSQVLMKKKSCQPLRHEYLRATAAFIFQGE